MAKVRRFENGLKLSIRARIVGLRLQDMDSMVGTTLTIEREIEDARSTRDVGVKNKRKESQSFLMIDLGLEVEAFREMMGNSSLGCRVRVGQMCRDRESGISVILLMVDLRVVDILGVDVILDMDELTAIGLSVIGTLAGLSYPTWSWSWVRLHMHVVGCVCAWNFGTKFFLRRGECKTRENSNFWKNGKIVISVKILNFSRSWMTKRISPLESSREI